MRLHEDENNDYFDGPDIPDQPKPAKEPKKPALKPEDPRYWDEPEDEFSHLKPRTDRRLWWWIAGAGLLAGLVIAAYIRWFEPYIVNAVQYGYVEDIDERGYLFKTFEGTILPYKNLMDTTRTYDGDFRFSTTDTEAAVMLRRMQYANRPVRVEYRVYRSILPWRGDTYHYVMKADSVDPRNILPPDRQPRLN